MNKKQLALLFVCNGALWISGNYMFSLLPVYAARLGADSASIGNYLALSFFAATAGTIGAGWLSNRFGRHKVFIVGAGLLNLVSTVAMGQITQFWQLVPLTVIAWLCGGITISMTTIMAGLFSAESERGKIFGLLGLNGGIGALVGGALSGPVVDRWGFAALFLSAGLGPLMTILVGLPLPDITGPHPQPGGSADPPLQRGTGEGRKAPVRLGAAFYTLV